MNLTAYPILTALLCLPLLGALFISTLPQDAVKNARLVALWTTLVTFLLSLSIWISFDKANPGFQFLEEYAWLGSIKYKVGVDGISMLFVILTTFLMPLCILASWESIEKRVPLPIRGHSGLTLCDICIDLRFGSGLDPIRVTFEIEPFRHFAPGSPSSCRRVLAVNHFRQLADIDRLFAEQFPSLGDLHFGLL